MMKANPRREKECGKYFHFDMNVEITVSLQISFDFSVDGFEAFSLLNPDFPKASLNAKDRLTRSSEETHW